MSPSVTPADAPMDLSTKTRRKLRLEEFLRQNLDQAPATRVIQWVDREQGIFRILWTHQSSGAFTQQDAALFRYWALARGKPANLSSVELKQSLRMALNKSPSVERLTVANDEYRYFRFTDWANRRRNLGGMKSMKGQQQETMRKRSPPPLVPIAKQRSTSPQQWSPEHYNLLVQAEKTPTPCNQDMLRDLLGPYSRSPLIGNSPLEIKEEQHEQGDRHVTRGHQGEQSVFAHTSPKPFVLKDQLMGDSTHGLGLLQRHYMDDALTLDFRIRGKALREPCVAGNHLLGEHLKYLSKPSSPQAYSEPLHAVPSYKESLTRPDLEGPFSLYGDGSRYVTSFPHYDYRSSGPAVVAAAAALYSVPDQALATPMATPDSRLLKVMY